MPLTNAYRDWLVAQSGQWHATLIGTFENAPRDEQRSRSYALIPDTVQLHARNMGEAHSEPEDRREAAKEYIEGVGGKLHGFWYAFGDYDGYTLWEAPDNVSMAATALAIGAGGALSSVQTTVLLTVDETLAALKKASSIKYRTPGA